MTHRDIVLIAYGVFILFVFFLVYRWQKNRVDYADFDLTDLLMENGKLSRLAVTWLGSFSVMTLGFVYLLVHDKLTDTYVGLYTATWVAPIVAKMWAPPAPAKPVEAPGAQP